MYMYWYMSISFLYMCDSIILQGSGLGLVALWPDLCFAQGATVQLSCMSFYFRLDHSSKLCLMFVIFSTTMLFMLSTRCTLERRLSFLESSQLLAPLPSSPPRLSTTPTPSSSSPWLSSSKPITSKIFNNSGFHLNHDPINVPL